MYLSSISPQLLGLFLGWATVGTVVHDNVSSQSCGSAMVQEIALWCSLEARDIDRYICTLPSVRRQPWKRQQLGSSPQDCNVLLCCWRTSFPMRSGWSIYLLTYVHMTYHSPVSPAGSQVEQGKAAQVKAGRQGDDDAHTYKVPHQGPLQVQPQVPQPSPWDSTSGPPPILGVTFSRFPCTVTQMYMVLLVYIRYIIENYTRRVLGHLHYPKVVRGGKCLNIC